MAVEAVRMADKKGGAFSFPRPLHQAPRGSINQLYILAVDRFRRNAEGFRPRLDLARSCFAIVGVFVVKIIFAQIDHGQLPQRGRVHAFVQEALPKGALAEKADSDLIAAAHLGRHGRAGGDACAAAYDSVGS